MEVIDHEPHFWFLLRKEQGLFLDISCNHGPAGYDVLIELNVAEEAQYLKKGRNFINLLAQAIQDSAPGVRNSLSVYQNRNVSAQYADEVNVAVKKWWADLETLH